MQLNKSKRVQSAIALRNPSQLRLFSSKKKLVLLEDSNQKNFNQNIFTEFQSPEDSAIKQNSNLFKGSLKKSFQTPSVIRIRSDEGFLKYNYQTWRTINAAKSLSRLESMSKINDKDPIKINLQQKLQRIKLKHSQNNAKTLIQPQSHKNAQKNRNPLINQSSNNELSNRINQILQKWQKGRQYSSSIYRRKIQIISHESPNKKVSKKPSYFDTKNL